MAVCEKMIPGFGEVFRAISMKHIGLSTLQSRATAGVCRGTAIFALPGSNGACRDAWDEILVHQLDARYRPCNVAELVPRLRRDPSPRPEAISAEDVSGLREALASALAHGSIAGLLACMTDDEDATFLGPEGQFGRGPEAIRAALDGALAALPGATLSPLGEARVERGGLVARDTGTVEREGDRALVYSLVARRVDGAARCVALHVARG